MAPIVLQGSYTDNIKRAAGMGYDAVEIHVNDPHSLDIDEIQKTCEKNSISVSTLGTGMGFVVDGLCFTHPDISIREKAVDRIKAHIDIAQKLSSMVIIGSMRGNIPDLDDYKKYEAYAVDSTKEVVEYAAKQDVIVVMEAINRYETNFINNVEESLAFLYKVGISPYIQLHLDTFHMNIEEGDITKGIKQAKETLAHLHFADSDRWYPGHGHIDFKGIIEALKDIEYEGYIAFECLPLPTPYEAAENSLKNIKFLV